jgi:hypothetical protein
MTTPQLFVGIDISKKRLDVAVTPEGQTFNCPNTEAGIGKLVRRLKELNPQIILLEATGGYEFLLIAALREAELPACFINPKLVRNFARGAGITAKTDRLDAQVLALYACRMRPQPRILPSQQQQELKLLLTRRRQLLGMIQMENNRLDPFTSHRPKYSTNHPTAGGSARGPEPGDRRLLPTTSTLAGTGTDPYQRFRPRPPLCPDLNCLPAGIGASQPQGDRRPGGRGSL